MSIFYVPGPTQVFTGTGAAGAYEFLGYSEGGVQVSETSMFENVQADYSGGAPADVQWMGAMAYINMSMARFNWAILRKLTGRLRGATGGVFAANSIGSLMVAEELGVALCLKFPYAGKTHQSSDIRSAMTFGAAFLNENMDSEYSTRVYKPRVGFTAIPVFNHVNLTATLYTETLPTLPVVN